MYRAGGQQLELSWDKPRNGKLEAAFWVFHLANPHVYKTLVYYAREWKQFHAHGSIKFLFERARWQLSLSTDSKDGFKLNNNYHAFYARLIQENEADLRGFFHFRKQKIQSSFGPLNVYLPPGDHVA